MILVYFFQLYFFAIKAINKAYLFFQKYIKTYYDFAYLRSKGVDTKLGYVTLVGLPIIHRTPGSVIKIGKGSVLVSNSNGNIAGVNHPVILATTKKEASIIIGDNFGASGSAIVAQTSIKIGDNIGVGANSHIYDTDFHPIGWRQNNVIKSMPITIGNYVWIAANCLILKGVNLADDTVIGAGTIVTKSTMPGSVITGKSSRLLKYITRDD